MRVTCVLKNCSSQLELAEKLSPRFRYVCSHHTESQLKAAGIQRTERTDGHTRFQDFAFDRTLKGRGNHRYTRALPEHPEFPGNYAYDDNLSQFGIQVTDGAPEGMTDVPVAEQ